METYAKMQNSRWNGEHATDTLHSHLESGYPHWVRKVIPIGWVRLSTLNPFPRVMLSMKGYLDKLANSEKNGSDVFGLSKEGSKVAKYKKKYIKIKRLVKQIIFVSNPPCPCNQCFRIVYDKTGLIFF